MKPTKNIYFKLGIWGAYSEVTKIDSSLSAPLPEILKVLRKRILDENHITLYSFIKISGHIEISNTIIS